MNQSITYNLHSYVARIRLNMPQNGNTVNFDNMTLLLEYLNKAAADDMCRVVVIEGSEGIFSRGMDFDFLLKNTSEEKITADFSKPYIKTVMRIRNFPKPVIAAVDGETAAGGMGIALACDIILATKRSEFGLSEVIFGIIPAYVFPFLLERVPLKKARFMVLSSKKFSADQAFDLGIVDEVAENDKLKKVLKQYIKRLLASSPDALRITKSYSDKIFGQNIQKAIETAGEQLTELLNNQDNINAIRGFLEGEMMPWSVKYKSVR